jgi:NAD(P)-dependent dehydrogenase (short-subunit alcohol dehydrogenase family)
MRANLDGMVILITGAARGIGAEIAAQAAEAGAEALVLVDRDPVTTDLPGAVERIAVDLALPDTPQEVIATALARFGRIDGLVNAAGLTTRGGYGDTTVELWNRMFSVNTRAPFFLMSGAMSDMTARGQPGSIVNILSMNAHCGQPDLAVYSATKGALQTLTKNAAHAHMADHIRVNGINLGWTDTQTERHLHAVTLGRGDGWLDAQAAAMPLGRLISAEDCARHAVWMLCPASAPMTGICLDLEQTVIGAP